MKLETSKRGLWPILGQILLVWLTGLLLLIGYLCFFSAIWYVNTYGHTGFDSVLYTLSAGFSGVQSGLIANYLLQSALPAVLCAMVTLLILYFPLKKPLRIRLFGKRRRVFPFHLGVSGVLGVMLCLSLTVHAAFNVELVEYIYFQRSDSDLYWQEYKDPNRVNISFPEKKRNLVYIILESMETSYLSKEEGGALDNNVIPELTALAKQYTNFSHNDTVGGFSQVPGVSWTVASMVAQTGGVPLKVPEGITDQQNGYGRDGVFLPGLTTLQNILHNNGYYQALMVGSDANYGGRKTYYTTHDLNQVYDLHTARGSLVPEDYFVWWGFEDYYLFDYAKEKLTQIASDDQPFAFTMLTADTHHVGGYPCKYCRRTYKENYENVISCSSRQVYAFLQWLQEQPFYENTTVIITGDHNSMDAGFFQRNVEEGYQRHIYNCFINAAAQTDNTANRQFTALDLFPTTLAALGCTIEGDRLGLGVNLFSDQPTLMERMGYDTFTEELSKQSDYYHRFYQK